MGQFTLGRPGAMGSVIAAGTGEHPDGENIFYYLTVYNEPYPQPAAPTEFPGGTALNGQPKVILAHIIRAGCRGKDFEARNVTHQMKTLNAATLKLKGGPGPANLVLVTFK